MVRRLVTGFFMLSLGIFSFSFFAGCGQDNTMQVEKPSAETEADIKAQQDKLYNSPGNPTSEKK